MPLTRTHTPQKPAGVTLRPLSSRLHPPRPALALVRRAALLDLLAATSTPLILLSAPPGSGKTSLMLQWFDECAMPKAWLSLDHDANDPVVLLAYLGLALAEICEVDPQVLEWLRLPALPVAEAVLPAFAAAISAAPPFIFVFDDAQRMTAASSWGLLADLFDALPPGSRVAVAGRRDPDVPLGRLRVSGRLTELRFPDLALDHTEATQLLTAHSERVDEGTVEALLAATEGWAAGLYLAALSQVTAQDADGPLRGESREVGRYLTAEVLVRQPTGLHRFLLETSILERLCPDLCRTVTGRRDAGELLRRLADENLFVWALDDRQWWYRYHHLFAEYLQAELECHSHDEVHDLHARAAQWFEEQGDVEAATRHWLAAGEAARAAEVVCQVAMPYTSMGRIQSVQRWLELFSDEQIRGEVTLTLLAGWLYVFSGSPIRGNERLARLWESSDIAARADDTPFPDGGATLRGWRAAIQAITGANGVTSMRCEAALASSPDHAFDPAWRNGFEALHGTALWLSGDDAQADETLHHAASEGALYNPLSEMGAWSALSLLAASQGRWREAAAYADRGMACMREHDLSRTSQASAAYLAQAVVLAHAGDQAALEPAAAAALVCEQARLWPWAAALTSTLLTECYIDLGEIDEAEHWARAAESSLAAWPDAGILHERLRRSRARLLARRGIEPLSRAETRVLELLPERLSNEEMAARLFVSVNTVRSELHTLYRKLGVGSRAQALRRARELGLLPG